ncbi:21678_t:CDS:2, partial [Gigaspora margarita]
MDMYAQVWKRSVISGYGTENRHQLFLSKINNGLRPNILDYEEDKGTYLTSVPNTLLCTTRVNDEEYFENEIKKKSIKFIPWIELSDISELDKGHFGSIIKAYWIKAHKNIICKTLRNLEDINSKYYSAFIQELTMQTRVDLCENIVRFLGISKAPELLKNPELDYIPFSKKTDIYSLEDIIAGTPEEYWKLYCKYWDADPNKCPDIEYVYDVLHKLLETIKNDYPSIPLIKCRVTQNLVAQIEDARYCTNIQASGLDKLTIEIRT